MSKEIGATMVSSCELRFDENDRPSDTEERCLEAPEAGIDAIREHFEAIDAFLAHRCNCPPSGFIRALSVGRGRGARYR